MSEQREILYRGKRNDNGEWVYGFPFKYSGNQIGIAKYDGSVEMNTSVDSDFSRWDIFNLFVPKVDPATVGQYTGRKDKNGKRIFEGDILHFINAYRGASNAWHCIVEFRDGDFVCQNIDRCSDYGEVTYNHFDSWNYPTVQWDVIGNIHDNPELLEAKHEGERRNGAE